MIAGARGGSTELRELVDGGRVYAVSVDLSTADGPQQLIDAGREHGQINILVNNAGAVTPRLDGFLAVNDADWLAEPNLTFMAAVRATRAALPDMLTAGAGTIVNVSSVNSFLADPAVIDYCAAKAALANFSNPAGAGLLFAG